MARIFSIIIWSVIFSGALIATIFVIPWGDLIIFFGVMAILLAIVGLFIGDIFENLM